MKLTQLFEGHWIVKNLDGKEKYFKDPNSALAKEWAATGKESKKPISRISKKQQFDAAVDYAWSVISTTDGWGELDWTDIVRMKIIPKLKKSAGDIEKYGDAFDEAVWQAQKSYGDWTALMKYFDAGARKYGREKGFSDWADSMSDYVHQTIEKK